MAGRGSKQRGGPPKKPRVLKPYKSIIKNHRSGAATTSYHTTTDAATSGDESTRRRKTPTNVQRGINIVTANQFDVNGRSLSDYGEEIILTRQQTKTRVKKLPPLVVVNSDAAELRTLLQSAVQSKNFSIRSMSIGTRVDVLDENEHTAMQDALKAKNIAFYAYHSPNSKPLKFVLHGLSEQNTEELKTSLTSLGITPTDLKALNIKKKRYNGQAVYLLYFAPGTMNLTKLREIKHIDHVAVRWERYKPPPGNNLSQCRNCQLHGHSSVNCHMPSKCLVCAEPHKTDVCPKRIPRLTLKQKQQESSQQLDRSFIKCANCGKNHTSNFMGCEKRKQFLEAQAKVVNQRHQNRPKRVSFLDNEMFPALDRRGPAVHTTLTDTSQPSWADVIQGIKQEQSSATTLIGTIQSMMESMNKMLAQLSQLVEVLVKHSLSTPHMDYTD